MRVLAILLLLICSTATAEPLPGARSGTTTQYSIEGQQVWDELTAFGTCYASTSRSDALKLVATRAGSPEEAATYKHLFEKPYQFCLGSITNLRVPYQLVRGAIAEGLYYNRVEVPPTLAVSTAPTREQVHSLSDAAVCYSSQHRDTAQTLVEQTKAGSKKELDAVTSLSPELFQCFPPTVSSSVQLDSILVRFRIAEALWRLGAVRR
jgi:hypothetical protein